MLGLISIALAQIAVSLGALETAVAAYSPPPSSPDPPAPARRAEYNTQAEIRTLIAEMAKAYGVSQYLALELGFIESRYDPSARNPSSTATGLFQFIDSTWDYYCEGDRIDPYDNARCAMERIADGGLWHWTADPNIKSKLARLGLL